MKWWIHQAAARAPRRAGAAVAVLLELALTAALGAVDVTADQQPRHSTRAPCPDCGRQLR